MAARPLAGSVLALGAIGMISTLAVSQAPPNPQTPPNQQTPPGARDQDPTRPQQPGTQTPARPGTQTPRDSMRGGLDALEGQWTFTLRITEGAASGTPREVRGISSRTWMLDESVLREDLRVLSTDTSPTGTTPRPGATPPNGQRPGDVRPGQDRPGQDRPATDRPGQDRPIGDDDSPSLGDVTRDFEGLGLFSFDPQTREVAHVWADSMSRGMVMSLGRYDPATRTITFARHMGTLKGSDSDEIGAVIGTGAGNRGDTGMGQDPSRPGDPNRPGQDPVQPGRDPNRPDQDPDRPGIDPNRPGADPGRPGARPGETRTGQPVVTLRLINENQHVITMSRPGAAGQQATTYEITYTRQGATGPGQTPPRRPGMNQPNTPDGQPNRPGNDQP